MQNNTLINPIMLETDRFIPLDAPAILRKAGPLGTEQFLAQLMGELHLGLTPEERFTKLIQEGQIDLATLVKKYLNENFAQNADAEISRMTRQFRAESEVSEKSLLERLHMNRGVVDEQILAGLEDMLRQVRAEVREKRYDQSRAQHEIIARLLDYEINKSKREMQQRFESAQAHIMDARRVFWERQQALPQQGAQDIVLELLGYAERLSFEVDCDLAKIEGLCSQILQICQGASPNAAILAEYRALFKASQPAIPARPTPLAVLPATPQKIEQKRETLSPEALGAAEKVVGSGASLLLADLYEATPQGEPVTTEEAASALRLRLLRLVEDEASEASGRAEQVLGMLVVLIKYWGRRKVVVEKVYRDLRDGFLAYAALQARDLLHRKRWEAAADYYRAALRMSAAQQTLIGVEHLLVEYFMAAAAGQLPSASPKTMRADLSRIEAPAEVMFAALNYASAVEDYERLGLALVKLCIGQPWLLQICQMALNQHGDTPLANKLAEALLALLQRMGYLEHPPLMLRLKTAVENGQTVYRRLNSLTQEFVALADTSRDLKQMATTLGEIKLYEPLAAGTEAEILHQMLALENNLRRYQIPTLSFAEREGLAETTRAQLDNLEQQLQILPTELGRFYLQRMVTGLHTWLEDDQTSRRQAAVPLIEVEVERTGWRADKLFYCSLRLTNRREIRAENVRLRVMPPEGALEYAVVDKDEIDLEAITAAHPANINVRVQPKPLTQDQDAFTLYIHLSYQIPQQIGLEKRTFQLRVAGLTASIEEFKVIRNPYYQGVIVKDREMFFGRDELIEQMLAEVAHPERTGAVVIYGQKRSGKSSLLYHLGQRAPASILHVYFDIPRILGDLPRIGPAEATETSETVEQDLLARFLLALIRDTAGACHEAGLTDIVPLSAEQLKAEPGPTYQFREFLRGFRQRANGRRLLYIFDEFNSLVDKIDQAVIDETIMRMFKSLIEQGFFSCVISGITEVFDAVERFANQLAIAQPLSVDYLEADAARALIQEPIRFPDGISRFYSPEIVSEIIHLTAGSPFYLQIFCHRLVTYMNKAKIERVTMADIPAVVHSLTRDKDHLPEAQFDNLYQYKENTQDRNAILEGLIMHLLAHETAHKEFATVAALQKLASFISGDDIERTLNRLTRRKTIVEHADEVNQARHITTPLRLRRYSIRVDLFRRWLLIHRPVDPEMLRSFERRLH